LVFHLGSFQSPGCLAAVGQDHRPYRAAENPPRAGLNARGCLGMTTEIPERLWVPTTALHPPWQQLKKAGPGAGRSRTDGETFGSGPRPADDGGRSARAAKLSPLSSALLAAPTGPVRGGWRRAWGRYADYSSPGLSPPSPGGPGDGGGGPGCWQRTTLFCVSGCRSWAVPGTAAEGGAAGRGLRLAVPLAAMPWWRGERVGSTVSNQVCDTSRFLLCAICPDSIHLSCPHPLWRRPAVPLQSVQCATFFPLQAASLGSVLGLGGSARHALARGALTGQTLPVELSGPGLKMAVVGRAAGRGRLLSTLSAAVPGWGQGRWRRAAPGNVDCFWLRLPPPSLHSAGADGGGRHCWLGTTFLQCLPSPLPGRQRVGGGGCGYGPSTALLRSLSPPPPGSPRGWQRRAELWDTDFSYPYLSPPSSGCPDGGGGPGCWTWTTLLHAPRRHSWACPGGGGGPCFHTCPHTPAHPAHILYTSLGTSPHNHTSRGQSVPKGFLVTGFSPWGASRIIIIYININFKKYFNS